MSNPIRVKSWNYSIEWVMHMRYTVVYFPLHLNHPKRWLHLLPGELQCLLPFHLDRNTVLTRSLHRLDCNTVSTRSLHCLGGNTASRPQSNLELLERDYVDPRLLNFEKILLLYYYKEVWHRQKTPDNSTKLE